MNSPEWRAKTAAAMVRRDRCVLRRPPRRDGRRRRGPASRSTSGRRAKPAISACAAAGDSARSARLPCAAPSTVIIDSPQSRTKGAAGYVADRLRVMRDASTRRCAVVEGARRRSNAPGRSRDAGARRRAQRKVSRACAASPDLSVLFSRPARSSSSSPPAIVAAVIWKFEQDLPDYRQLKNYEPPVMTRVHAADGSLLAEYCARAAALSALRRPFPPLVKKAFISAEDKNFYTPPRLRSRRHRARGHRVPAGLAARPGRLDHHPAGGEELPAELRPHVRAQDPRDPAQPAHRGGLFEGEDPRALSQRDLSRPRQLRRRRRGAELFRQVGARTDDRRGRLSRGAAEGAERAQSVPQPRPRRRAAQLRDRPHGRGRLHHRRAGDGRRAPSRSSSIRAC